MSVRRMLYLVSFLMTLIPLALFSYYEYGQVNERVVESRISALEKFSIAHGDILLDIHEIYKYWIETEVWDIRDKLDIAEALDTQASAVTEALAAAADSAGYSGTNARNVEYVAIADADGRILAANDKLIVGESVALSGILTWDATAMSGVIPSGFEENEYGVWVSSPVGDKLTMLAFVNIDAYVSQYSQIKIGQTSYAFLVNENGVIVYHPVDRFVGTVVGNDEISDSVANYLEGGGPETDDGENMLFGSWQIYAYRVIPKLNCVVCIVQDKNEVMAANRPYIVDVLIVAILFTAISLAIVVPLLQSRIIKPIFELKRCMNGSGTDGFGSCGMKLDNEIGELISGYNQMVEQLKYQMNSLRLSNEALTEAEERLKEDKEKLKISEQRFKSATELSTIAVFELVTYTNEFFCSDGWETITTYKAQKIYPLDYVLRTIIHPDYRTSITEWMDEMEGRYDEDLRIITSDGGLKWVHITMATVDDETTEIKKITGTLTDINERMVAMELTNYVAYHESLTGFPRRVLYVTDISRRLPVIGDDSWGAVIILSMENIRRVNDIFGFAVGDQVIMLIAAELTERFGEQMYCARNTGNSFLLFCETPRDADYIQEICDNLLDIFKNPFLASEMSVLVRAHVGVALYPDHGTNVEELIQNADIAMHEARYEHKEDSATFDPIMLAKVRRTHQIMEVLRDFEANQALYIQYQPIVNMDRRCVGFEALVRMDISPIGYISPVEFIPLAEESKMIIPIGRAILKNSCLKAVELFEKGFDFNYMSVNVSTIQLEDDGFLDMFYSVMEETKMPLDKLQIEVTESIMISDIRVASDKLGDLRKHGVKIALDDFGTGYSSMKYLRVIPLDVIKIDKHFIDEISSNEKQQLFAFTMIQMAHDIGLRIVAEGVETEVQFEILKARGCDTIQGYLTSRPLFESNLEEFLAQHRKDR